MANTFKLKTDTAIGTTLTTVYTVPQATTTVVIGCVLANIVNAQVKTDVQIVTASVVGENADDVYLIKNLPVPSGSSFELIEGKVVLEAGDMVKVESDTASSVDIALSVLEQT
ncbi:MAG: hypothetical protein GY905_08710 [Gammaproteobacteria bacterium]|jgi:hypothetical protein|nr:hypothetical protein [Gammaproteobacteria bacterium]